jgi:uncharacterized protein YeaO (DUF488 family)
VARRPTPAFVVHRVHGIGDGPTGRRVRVDRLWPRRVSKVDAALDEWAKDVAPSADVRRWYGHDPATCDEFARRYRDEPRPVILLTATRDVDHSDARILLDHLTGHRRRPSKSKSIV